jgi:hypothetical protein
VVGGKFGILAKKVSAHHHHFADSTFNTHLIMLLLFLPFF